MLWIEYTDITVCMPWLSEATCQLASAKYFQLIDWTLVEPAYMLLSTKSMHTLYIQTKVSAFLMF